MKKGRSPSQPRIPLTCDNKNCRNRFFRERWAIVPGKQHFCCRSCAAVCVHTPKDKNNRYAPKTKQPTITDWFDSARNPVRAGLYRVQTKKSSPEGYFEAWREGNTWWVFDDIKRCRHEDNIEFNGVIRWRGKTGPSV